MPVLAHFSIPHQIRSQNTTFSTPNHIPVWKSKNQPTIPLPRTKTSHKPVPSAQNPPFLRVGDQKKSGCGKRRHEEGSNDFQVSTKVPPFASGRRRKRPCADEGRRWKEWEIGVGNFSVVSHTGRGKGENGEDGNASSRTKCLSSSSLDTYAETRVCL